MVHCKLSGILSRAVENNVSYGMTLAKLLTHECVFQTCEIQSYFPKH